MTGTGARSRAAIDQTHLEALNSGIAATRTLAEALAIDQSALLSAVIPNASEALRQAAAEAQELGILKRMTRIGAALAAELDEAHISRVREHPSDTVRGWACFALAAGSASRPAQLLEQLRPLADDEHFAVREWVWMAARPTLVADLDTSIALLTDWTADPSERVRRFASESLRPRGVWATHITTLKQHPERGEPILNPLRADPSRYVQDSVANWINDAAKTREDWAITLCRSWKNESDSPATSRIVQRALRSIDKQSRQASRTRNR